MKKGQDVEYIDVLGNADNLNTMMKYSGGSRKVPIIVHGDDVSIGFNGKA